MRTFTICPTCRQAYSATLAFILWAAVAMPLWAIEPPAKGRASDAELTRSVQAVLAADSKLSARSLIVSVVDGVAVIGGPVASADESTRIGQLLRVVPGLTDVKISVWVPAIEDPLKKQVVDRLRGVSGVSEASTPNRLVSKEPRPAARITVQRYEPPPPEFALLNDPLPKSPVELKRSDAAYSPLPAPVPAAPPGPPQYPTIPPPAVPIQPAQDVASAIEELRRADPRYAGLSVQMQAGFVTIRGQVVNAEDSWDFIASVRKVPGVERVLIGRIELR